GHHHTGHAAGQDPCAAAGLCEISRQFSARTTLQPLMGTCSTSSEPKSPLMELRYIIRATRLSRLPYIRHMLVNRDGLSAPAPTHTGRTSRRSDFGLTS